MESHVGHVLLQLPPNLLANPDALDTTLQAFGGLLRVAVEARDPSWFVDEIRSILDSHQAALCLVDGGPVAVPRWRTADWGYVRFHRGASNPEGCYSRSAMDTWAKRVAGLWAADEDVYCYFNNDGLACALRDARRFALAVERVGRQASRVPASRDVMVG
jgi:uncharacterized protein YecE (DUF72 family)